MDLLLTLRTVKLFISLMKIVSLVIFLVKTRKDEIPARCQPLLLARAFVVVPGTLFPFCIIIALSNAVQ
jgi:heme/copper-type cytochrome/quinol oxidase subunit 2